MKKLTGSRRPSSPKFASSSRIRALAGQHGQLDLPALHGEHGIGGIALAEDGGAPPVLANRPSLGKRGQHRSSSRPR
jgi:hypothetical protein